MRLAAHLPDFTTRVEQWFETNAPHLTREAVTAGRDAWFIAHRTGIVRASYDVGRDVVDAHIQTALQRIFPNVVFLDAKRY